MKSKKQNVNDFLRILFSLVGLLSLINILNNYGLDVIQGEVKRSGAMFIIIALTFIPTLLCYAVSWLLATDHKLMLGNLSIFKKIALFSKYTAMSISWNNLTPFLKVGGEPVKYMMLQRHLPKREAISSTINYNIIHLLATGISFVLCSFLLVVFYQQSFVFFYYSLGIFVFLLIVMSLGYKMLHSRLLHFFKIYQFRFLKKFFINLKIGMRRLVFFYRKNPMAFTFSLLIDLAARFIEGITFYVGFDLIRHPISLLSSSLLDVGRTFFDTIFFFIPYQIGAREEGVHFFMEKIMSLDSQGFLTVVLFYRFVEIFWIVIGYSFWVSRRRFSTVVSV